MKANPQALTLAAIAGYNAASDTPNPHYLSSSMGLAWAVGRRMGVAGMSEPSDVAMSRGYKVRVRDMLFLGDTRLN